MKFRSITYGPNRAMVLLRSVILFVVILFVLVKPLYNLTSSFSKCSLELSSTDSDENNSDLNDSQEDQEDSEEEVLEESYISVNPLNTQLTIVHLNNFNFSPNHISDYRLGIIVPPPEVA